MAKTAAITLGASSGTAPTNVNVICTITNGDTAAATVIGIQPTVVAKTAGTATCPIGMGMPNLGPGMPVTVAGSNGTLAPVWSAAIYSPWSGAGLAEPSSQVYTFGALVYLSDGTVVTATTADYTASAPSH